MRYLVAVIVLVGWLTATSAQELRTSLGKDFWVAFPPTEHEKSGSLSIFISADETATIKVEGRRQDGTQDTRNFTVAAGSVQEVKFVVAEYELRSAEYPAGSIGDCEQPKPQSVHVLSDVDVAAYAVVRDAKTSDAWMVLPTKSLGLDHRILSYPSERVSGFGFGKSTYYPSQFVLVATEDDTQIDITLNVPRSRVATGGTRNITLNKGESYLVQAAISSTFPNDDLTGSRVKADKPIVVLGSHYRAQVPVISSQASRDILVEQMQSVDVWGKRYVVPPLQPPNVSSQSSPNDVVVIRILTCTDSTTVEIEGIATQTIARAGGIWELPLGKGRAITANKPIMVGIYDRTANRDGMPSNSGDPSLIVVPPVEQFLSSYRTVNVEPLDLGKPVYDQHQLTIFAPLSATGISVDGSQSSTLTPIGTSGYGYTHLNVSAGVHRSIAVADPVADTVATFGILIYGYGPAESYGYTGGMAFEKLYQPRVVLRALDVVASPGDSTAIIVVVDSIHEPTSLQLLGASSLASEVSFNSTTWVPDPALFSQWSVLNTTHATIAFSYSFDTLRVGDTVARFSGRTTLGSVVSDSILLGSVAWHDKDGDALDVAYQTFGAVLRIAGVCDKNGLRLFDPFQTNPQAVRYFDLLGREVNGAANGPLLLLRTLSNGNRTLQRIIK